MTRKDYVRIAAAIAASRPVEVSGHRGEWRAALFCVASKLGTELAADNPRFDYERFMTACGVN